MWFFHILSALFCALYIKLALAQQGPTAWTTTPFNPFRLPLAVRNPYLNTWYPQGNDPPMFGEERSFFWSNVPIGWFVAIVVDNQAYRIAGGQSIGLTLNENVTQKSVLFTPTSTAFIMRTGPMDVNLTFLSPIEPEDLTRQSMPFSYLYITTESNDGNVHDVRLYSDITGDFLQDALSNANVSWSQKDDGTNIILSEQLVERLAFTEFDNRAADAIEYYCHRKIDGTTTSWQISSSNITRGLAINKGTSLNNMADAGQAPLSNGTVLGIQIDFGEILSTPEPAVFTLGLVRDPVIQYKLPNGTVQTRSHYYRSSFDTDIDALTFFMSDFERAQQASESFDHKLLSAGSSVSSSYSDLLALTTRQVFGSLDITLALGNNGGWNFADTMVFMKNMGAAGSDSSVSNTWTNSVNTVDTLFTAFPAFLYLNAEIAGHLLVPLLKYQDSPAYVQSYAAKNIGMVYPNATADTINQPHPFGIEESANMLIMTLAYTQTSGNKTLINNHYQLLRKWCNYLVTNTLTPSNQQWADYVIMQNNLPTNNQTNLMLKGIIAIAAMSRIASLVGNDADASQYNGTAVSYIQAWQDSALTSSTVNFFADDTSTSGLIYNIYADVMLSLGLVPPNVYNTLTKYYSNFLDKNTYGIPLVSQIPDLTSVSAMMLSAGAVTENATRNTMIAQVRSYASSNLNSSVFCGYYDPLQGSVINQDTSFSGHGINSPTVGSTFVFLLNGTTGVKTSSTPNISGRGSNKQTVGTIVGAIVGGSLVMIGGGLFFLLRWRRSRPSRNAEEEGNGRSSHSKLRRRFIIHPFPFLPTIHVVPNKQVSQEKDLNLLHNDIPRAKVTAGINQKIIHQPEANRNKRSLRPELPTGVKLQNRPKNLTSMLRRGGGEQKKSLPPALVAIMSHRARELQDEADNLRRKVEMMRVSTETDSVSSPPTYRE